MDGWMDERKEGKERDGGWVAWEKGVGRDLARHNGKGKGFGMAWQV